ncbi:unnamed protein product [Vicia faba]|uniref:Uncharacterized protein n=1 Tax=Vicia faba TaxID=3906 RepID=A0AAV1A2M0_VICFA|nr:unnamed protein product [Vicia faba]
MTKLKVITRFLPCPLLLILVTSVSRALITSNMEDKAYWIGMFPKALRPIGKPMFDTQVCLTSRINLEHEARVYGISWLKPFETFKVGELSLRKDMLVESLDTIKYGWVDSMIVGTPSIFSN